MPLRSLLLQPRWLVASTIIVVATVTFATLGRWQLQRLDDVRAQNAVVAERFGQPPLAFEDVADVSAGDEDRLEALEYRALVVSGTYLPEEEVLQRSRAHNGQNGYHVLTPLVRDDGRAVLVRRGWVPYSLDEPPVAPAAPPAGEVTVSGFLQRSEEQRGFGPTDPAEGELSRVFRADVTRLDQQMEPALFPMVVALETQEPPQQGRLPIPTSRPELDEANHLSYALQWFSFAAIAAIGYGAVLWKRTRDEEEVGPDRARDDARPEVTRRS